MQEAYEAAKAADPEFYRDGDSLLYGQAAQVPAEAVDRMAAELEERRGARKNFSRRRKHYEERDIDSINDRNAHFNRKLDRAYGTYTAEIKQVRRDKTPPIQSACLTPTALAPPLCRCPAR